MSSCLLSTTSLHPQQQKVSLRHQQEKNIHLNQRRSAPRHLSSRTTNLNQGSFLRRKPRCIHNNNQKCAFRCYLSKDMEKVFNFLYSRDRHNTSLVLKKKAKDSHFDRKQLIKEIVSQPRFRFH